MRLCSSIVLLLCFFGLHDRDLEEPLYEEVYLDLRGLETFPTSYQRCRTPTLR